MKTTYEKLLKVIEKAEGEAILTAQNKLYKIIDTTNELSNEEAADLLDKIHNKLDNFIKF